MGSYLLTIDSSTRDLDKHPNPNDYSITLNRPLYDVSKIELTNGAIPFTGYTIDTYSNVFYFNDEVIPLESKNYTDASVLANDLETAIHDNTANNVSFQITYNADTNTFTFDHNHSSYSLVFTQDSPCEALGFSPGSYASDGNGEVTSGSIDLNGTRLLYLSVLPDTRERLKTELYIDDSNYMGTVIRHNKPVTYLDRDEAFSYNFPRGMEPSIRKIRVQFYVNNYGKLSLYDFKLQNHVMKFEIKCNLDKLNKKPTTRESSELPPVLKLQEFVPKYNKNVLVYGGATVVLIIIVMILSSFKHVSLRTRAGRAS